MIHELKILEVYADAKLRGDKLFEIRDNSDRDFQRGDRVKYKVTDKHGIDVPHELENKTYEITYVTHYAQRDGYVVFGEREVHE